MSDNKTDPKEVQDLLEKITGHTWRVMEWDGAEWPDKRWSVGDKDSQQAVCICPRYSYNLDDAELIALAPKLAESYIQASQELKAALAQPEQYPQSGRRLNDEDIKDAYEEAMGQALRPQDRAAVLKVVRAAMDKMVEKGDG